MITTPPGDRCATPIALPASGSHSFGLGASKSVNDSDPELVARWLRSGDTSARDELIVRYLGRVRRMVWPMVLDDEVADDVTQDVFVRVFQGLATFNGKARFSTWLFRIAMNATRDYQRRAKRTLAVAVTTNDAPDRRSAPDVTAMGAEFGRDIEQALTELTPKLRAAIVLVAMNGLSPSEAAAIDGCSTATMHWRVHQARKQLKQKLHKHLKSG